MISETPASSEMNLLEKNLHNMNMEPMIQKETIGQQDESLHSRQIKTTQEDIAKTTELSLKNNMVRKVGFL